MDGKIFDTHAHYDDPKFDGIRDETIKELFESGNVGAFVNVGTSPLTNRLSLEIAKNHRGAYAACGYHPHEIVGLDEKEATEELLMCLKDEKCRAIGEIGLDFHYDAEFAELQKHWFRLQMKLAEDTGMPVIIHDREAHGPSFDIVCEFPKVKGVFHSFSGSCEMAKELIKRGWFISFSGVVTFKNASRLAEVVKSVPLDRLLLETDCPYLAPEPVRGTVNDSRNIKYTASKIADIKGISATELLDITYSNALEFYGIT